MFFQPVTLYLQYRPTTVVCFFFTVTMPKTKRLAFDAAFKLKAIERASEIEKKGNSPRVRDQGIHGTEKEKTEKREG